MFPPSSSRVQCGPRRLHACFCRSAPGFGTSGVGSHTKRTSRRAEGARRHESAHAMRGRVPDRDMLALAARRRLRNATSAARRASFATSELRATDARGEGRGATRARPRSVAAASCRGEDGAPPRAARTTYLVRSTRTRIAAAVFACRVHTRARTKVRVECIDGSWSGCSMHASPAPPGPRATAHEGSDGDDVRTS